MKIEIPDLSKGTHLVCVRQRWYFNYLVDGKVKRRSMKTTHYDEAVVERDKFIESLKTATTKKPRTLKEKVEADPTRYVYSRLPFFSVVAGKHLGFFKTKKLAIEARDNYINNQ